MSEDSKNTNELSEEELMAVAGTKTKEDKEKKKSGKKPKKLSEAHQFILACDVKAGDTKVVNGFIYEAYINWKKETRGPQARILERAQFFKQFSKFFPAIRGDTYRYRKLDPTPFDLTKEGFYATRRRLQKEEYRKKARKKEAKKGLEYIEELEAELKKAQKELREKRGAES